MARRPRVETLLADARRRGVGVYLYGTCPHRAQPEDVYQELPQKVRLDRELTPHRVSSYWGACLNGPSFLPYYLGRIRDARANYPEIDGLLNDGPEFGYEIAPELMGGNWDLFTCFGRCCRDRATALGFDWAELVAAAGRLHGWLRSLDEGRVAAATARLWERRAGPGDRDYTAVDALAEAVGDPAILEWFRFKSLSAASYVAALRAGVAAIQPSWRLGVGSRTAAFAPLTGYDQARLAPAVDFGLPKLYFWMSGWDGLYGTVFRWAHTLKGWNAGVADERLLELVFALFGFRLPEARTAADLTRHVDARTLHAVGNLDSVGRTRAGDPFPDAFFAGVVADETRLAIRRIGDPARVVPWVSVSHGGRTMTARELDLLLDGAEAGGLTRYLYFSPIEGEEWEIVRRHAGPT
jgi:hypothetical protein